jgi:hypothetical protein
VPSKYQRGRVFHAGGPDGSRSGLGAVSHIRWRENVAHHLANDE